MLILDQDVKKFIEDKLSLNTIRSGMHIVLDSSTVIQHKHFVNLLWIAELQYFKSPCYLSVVHSLDQTGKKTSKCLLYIPKRSNKFFLVDFTNRKDKLRENLSCVNLVFSPKMSPSLYRINLEIHTPVSGSFLSFDMKNKDESLSSVKTQILDLINWVASQQEDQVLQGYLTTRIDHNF